ncbi:hypothetical protein VTN77DRAFT_5924 [Rasamsonia byssochlamydoides]|uniref:uncharacterized protein n=1 Tax=Rasamsonia byssochlamydoides TaxID=89139 RepID=UPI00374429DE
MGNQSSPHVVRRFLPEPIETSSRSSKRHGPEPTDTCQMSLGESKNVNGDDPRSLGQRDIACEDTFSSVHSLIDAQKHESEPTETARRKRRFLPQPTETSTRSSRNHLAISRAEDENKSVKTSPPESIRTHDMSSTGSGLSTKHRALPQPIETSSMTSKSSLQQHQTSTAPDLNHSARESSRDKGGRKPARRFLPEPIESIKLSRRQGLGGSEGRDCGNSTKPTDPSNVSPVRNTPRKFAPQLIETAKRSFRKGEARATLVANCDGDQLPEYINRLRHTRLSCILYDPLAEGEETVSRPPESRFSYASLVRRKEGRTHSFRVPDLPPIPSNSGEGSEGSDVPSLSTSPSTSSDESAKRSKIRDQFRESCDERFSGYLLSLAARSAEKQLRDQALAAFPNEQVHQPVSHFAIDRDEEESDGEDQKVEVVLRGIKDNIVTFRRESTADLSWEVEQMRRHKEEAELRGCEQKNIDVRDSRFSAAAIAARQAVDKADLTSNAAFLGGWQKDVGLVQMRHAASPPMLGNDLVFPFSLSPQATRCENDQGLASHQESHDREDRKSTGLWCANSRTEHEDGAGLWMGLCRKDDELSQSPSKHFRSGIVTPTPDIDGESYLSLNKAASHSPSAQLLITPPESESSLDHMDKMPSLEEEIDREFNDGFVTQVYNYLSLGYPSVARYYDYELSKISGIPVEDLRRDDLRTDAKGYVGAPEGVGVNEEGVTGGRCMRWTALRLYIREWARQQPRMAGNDSNLDTWGVRERRGSWAV